MDHLTQQTTDIMSTPTWNCSWKPVSPLPGITLGSHCIFDVAAMSVSPQLKESIMNEHILGLGVGGRCRSSHAVFESVVIPVSGP